MKKLAESKPRCGGKQSSSVFGTCAHCGRMNIRLVVSARLGAIYCKSCYNNTYNRARVASPSARRVKHDWTPAEDVLLTRIYGHGERIEILNAFPTRSWSVINRRAKKLGLSRLLNLIYDDDTASIPTAPVVTGAIHPDIQTLIFCERRILAAMTQAKTRKHPHRD